MIEERISTDWAYGVNLIALRVVNGWADNRLFFCSHLAAFARMRIEAANGDPRAWKPKILARSRSERDHQLDFRTSQVISDKPQRQMRCRECDAQPSAAIIMAQQHHRCAVRAREMGEKFSLSDKGDASADNSFFVHRRGHERVQFVPQTTFGALLQPGNRRASRCRRAFQQV